MEVSLLEFVLSAGTFLIGFIVGAFLMLALCTYFRVVTSEMLEKRIRTLEGIEKYLEDKERESDD